MFARRNSLFEASSSSLMFVAVYAFNCTQQSYKLQFQFTIKTINVHKISNKESKMLPLDLRVHQCKEQSREMALGCEDWTLSLLYLQLASSSRRWWLWSQTTTMYEGMQSVKSWFLCWKRIRYNASYTSISWSPEAEDGVFNGVCIYDVSTDIIRRLHYTMKPIGICSSMNLFSSIEIKLEYLVKQS